MKHAGPAALEMLDPLLAELRTVDGLVEKRPGVFYRGSKAFLHFHEDPTGFYADVRLHVEGDFERVRTTTAAEQRSLVSSVRRALGKARSSSAGPGG